MLPPNVVRWLVPRSVHEAYRTAAPVSLEEMPDGPTLKRLRQAAGLTREVLAVCAGTTCDALADYEKGRTAFSAALQKSIGGRRVIAALVALDEARMGEVRA